MQQARMEFTADDAREHATGFGTIAFNYPVTIVDLKAHLSIELDDETEIPYQIQTNTATARDGNIRDETHKTRQRRSRNKN